MEQYNVTGMSCAACQARVEKAVNAVSGVESCAVSLLTNSMGVEGSASSEAIISAVEKAGYGASLKSSNKNNSNAKNKITNINNEDALKDTETPKMKKRLIASLILLIPLMYVSMGHMMWNFPLPGFLDGNHIAMGIYEMLLSGMIMVINQKFFINGFKGLIHKSPNMDTLVALGSMASFIYSVYALFSMSQAVMNMDAELVMKYMDEFYFESAAMILTLITVGKMLEAKSKGKTTDALRSLMKLAPKTAVILEDGNEKTVPIDEVGIGDLFVVKAGDQIPVDGIVREGYSAVNEAAFTGESIPVDKIPGDEVSAATINTSGYMVCEARRIGEDTALSQIIKMVSDAAATKAPIAKIADKVSGIFVPAVIAVAFVTFVIWLIVGESFGFSLARAISVLVISCPCALGLATPVAIMVGNGVGAKSGILFKNAATLEQTGNVQIVALDKTGTITTGIMKVTDIIPSDGYTERELLCLAASIESLSEHPISKAVSEKAREEGLKLFKVDDFTESAGNGLKGSIDGELIYCGNAKYIKEVTSAVIDELETKAGDVAIEGKTPVYFAKEKELVGIIAVADTMKTDSKEAIERLRNMGIYVVMLTGDNEVTANAIAREAGVDDVFSQVKPDGKEQVISDLMKLGKVAMVGDGINDAPALTKADVGIAIAAGTDIAIDAADVVLMKSSIMDVAAAVSISRATIRNIHENLFWAFFYNVIGIPLAAGCYIAAFGWTLNPMFGAAAMSLSSFCVVSNALRLNLIKPYSVSKDRKIKNAVMAGIINNTSNGIELINNNMEEKKEMKITVKGMMCPHCEAHVKEALEKIEGIDVAVANHSENLVTLTTSKDVAEADIKSAVEAAGYEYAGIA